VDRLRGFVAWYRWTSSGRLRCRFTREFLQAFVFLFLLPGKVTLPLIELIIGFDHNDSFMLMLQYRPVMPAMPDVLTITL
jgi:hypothetical protein